MLFRELVFASNSLTTPVASLCLATSLGAGAMAAVSAVVDWLITPWPIAAGMLGVSGMYLLFGVGCVVQQRTASDDPVFQELPSEPLHVEACDNDTQAIERALVNI